MERRPLVRMVNITKTFGGIRAVDDVSVDIYKGEVLAIVGDNGAGKSTLIKVLSGVYPRDKGSIFLDDREVKIRDPRDAKTLGIETVYQELSLVDTMDVADNIFLGREPCVGFRPLRVIRKGQMMTKSVELLNELGVQLPFLKTKVRNLSGGQRQTIAIARCLLTRPTLLILDEPMAALAIGEERKVIALIRQLRSEGMPICIIVHNLEHVFAVSDRIAVLRRGKLVGIRTKEKTDKSEIIRLIVGEEI